MWNCFANSPLSKCCCRAFSQMFLINWQVSAHTHRQGPSVPLLSKIIIAAALICPTAAGPCWQGSHVVCVEMVEAIITSPLLLWIPLDVHLSSPKPSLMETITNPTQAFERTRWGQQCWYELEQVTPGEGGVLHFLFMHCLARLSIHMVKPASAGLMHMQKSQTGWVWLLLHFNEKGGNDR